MTVATLFDLAAQRYDHTRRQLVPCFDDLYGAALQLLPPQQSQPFRVLDLGAGTGLLAAMIAAHYPNAHLTMVDLAEEMLARAAERMAPYSERMRILPMDMTHVGTLGPFEVVVSALAIHHLADAQKQALFHDIATILTPGGRFIHIEQIRGPTPAIEDQYEAIWQAAARTKGVGEADLAAARQRMLYDQTVPLTLQLHWLTEAGFEHINCWYQWYRFATYSGDRAR